MQKYFFEKLALWGMCVAVMLCIMAINSVRNAIEIDPRTNWLIILLAATILWAIIGRFIFRPARNRYLLRTRWERWWARQLSSVPPG